MSTTHIAGLVVRVNGRILQRCAVCGERLCDSLRTMMPLEPDGTAPTFPTWTENGLVRQDGNMWTALDKTQVLPSGSCIQLVEE